MSTDYFVHSANRVVAGTRAIVANVNDVADEIAVGLALLPSENELKLGLTRYAVDTGVADAYVVALPYLPTLTDGFDFTFRPINSSTGPSTINVNALGAKAVVLFDLSALGVQSIVVGSMVTVRYSSVGDHFILMSGAASVSAVNDASTLDGLDSTDFVKVIGPSTINGVHPVAASLSVNNTGITNGGNALRVYAENGASMGPGAASAWIGGGSGGSGMALEIAHSGSGAGISVGSSGPGIVVGAGAGGDGINITAGAVTGKALHVYSNVNLRTEDLVTLHQDYFAGTSTVLQVTQDSSGVGVKVDHTGTAGVAVDIASVSSVVAFQVSQTGSGGAAIITRNSSSNNTPALEVVQDHASSTNAEALTIRQDGTATAVSITSASSTEALLVTQTGTGKGINISHTGTDGIVLDINANNASRSNPLVQLHQDHASSGATIMDMTQDGTGYCVEVLSLNTGAALYAISSSYGGTSNAHRMTSSNAAQTGANFMASTVGTGNAGRFTANSASRVLNGATLNVSEQNASSQSDSLSITHSPTHINSRGIYVNVVGTANVSKAISVLHSGTGAADAVQISLAGSGNGLLSNADAAAGTAIRANSNVANRTQPLVEIVNNNATGSGVALTIQQDQGGAAIDLTSQGTIKFPATATPSADANTLDDYQEWTWTPILEDSVHDGAGTSTSTTNVGHYTKIGRIVFFTFEIVMTAIGDLTGDAFIAGLPYTSNSVAKLGSCVCSDMGNMNAISSKPVTGFVPATVDYITLRLGSTQGAVALDVADISDDGEISGHGFYVIG